MPASSGAWSRKAFFVPFRLLLLIAAICHCPMLHAQTEGMSLVVEMADGTRSAFLLSEKPEMTFEGRALVFRSQEAEIAVARVDFSYFHFERVEAGVPEPPSDGTLTAGMSLVVEMTDGTRSAFLLSEKPEMTFDDGDLVFRSEQAEIAVAREDFSYFHFENVEVSMLERSSGGTEAEFVTTGVLRVRGVKANAVAVYALDGSVCAVDKSVEGDAVTVSLRSLPRGVYVVRYGATSIKMSNN